MDTKKALKRRKIVCLIELTIVLAMIVASYYIIVLALYVAGVL